MFNSQFPDRKPIEFTSNPVLPDRPKVVPDKDEYGNFSNLVVLEPGDNRSPFDGVHFTRETMSLRAMLNSGVQLTEVSMPSLYSDPLSAARKLSNLESKISERLDEIQRSQSSVESSVNE